MAHRHIIEFHDVFEDKDNLYIVMGMCSGGELFDRIKQKKHYNEADAALVLKQCLEAIRYLHKNNVAHCDLKPANILFENAEPDANLKIIDFGMAKLVKQRRCSFS